MSDRKAVKRGGFASVVVRVLPVFRGRTIDERLPEFRVMKVGEGVILVPFDTDDGGGTL